MLAPGGVVLGLGAGPQRRAQSRHCGTRERANWPTGSTISARCSLAAPRGGMAARRVCRGCAARHQYSLRLPARRR
jgi:hypothetical protein